MTRRELADLVDYNYWARNRVLAAAAALGAGDYTREITSSFPSVRDTLVHTFSAEWVWLERWRGTSPTAPLAFDDYPDLATLTPAWHALEAGFRSHVAGRGDAGLTDVVDYRLMSGQPGRSVFWQMVQHVVNHGSYHRGQVVTMLRQLGAAPPKSMDLITFYRERSR
jgi:uncharacterized damage-inducible protein DinB